MDNKVNFLRGTSAEYESSIKDNDTFYYTTDTEKLYLGNKEITGGGVTIDNALSDTSKNPVQNKVINDALNEKASKDIMTGATSSADGASGLVPAPAAGDQEKFLRADGTWSNPVENDKYALKSLYSDTTINVGRKADSTVGAYSTAEGYNTTSGGIYSHAEGAVTTASGTGSHAEGSNTTASGTGSHAEGSNTKATNYASHAGGHYNAAMTTGGTSTNTTGTAFVIGNGTSSSALSNAFSVQFTGVVKAKSTITASTTADYAEFFEWLDENPDEEDRIGHFVTLDGDKIRIATNEDDYILGVVSGEPFVLGNGDCDTWNGMFLRDEFRRTIYEPAPKMIEILDSEGNPTGEFEEVEGEFEGTRPKLNPEYDHTQPYISRFDRKEWAPIGMLGVLAVRHDGTAVVNGYVTVNANGIATACDRKAENSYRVIKSNSNSVVEIIFR